MGESGGASLVLDGMVLDEGSLLVRWKWSLDAAPSDPESTIRFQGFNWCSFLSLASQKRGKLHQLYGSQITKNKPR